MGLKLKWFRARMSFKGDSPPEKYNTVTGIGFKQSSELQPTYKQINTEFITPTINPRPHGYQKTIKRELNPEISFKIRSALSRSLSNVNETDYKPVQTSNSFNDVSRKVSNNSIYDNQKSDTIINYEKRKAELLNEVSDDESDISVKQPKSILKKINGNENGAPRKPSNTNMSTISNVSSEPPPVNYDTLPRNKDTISQEWDENVNSDPFYMSIEDDHAYVIEVQEPTIETKDEPEMYAEVNKSDKKKKVISFEENVTEIDDPNRKRLSSVSTASYQSNDSNSYGNDYQNSKRTSYFQAGGATFSSQAASIFITNKKPISVNERRPTTFVPRRESGESDASA